MKSITSIKKAELTDTWYVVDVSGQKIGRASSIVAQILLGKLNPKTRSYLNPRVKVIVINASKLDIPTKRGETTFFQRYSGFPGGLKFESLSDVMKKDPSKALYITIKGMLPKNKRGNAIFSNLVISNDEIHNHSAQQPSKLDINKLVI